MKKKEIPSQGRRAPALPKLAGKLAKIVRALAEHEELGFFDTAQAAEARRAFVAKGVAPNDAIALLGEISDDIGEVIPKPDFGGAIAPDARAPIHREHSRLGTARYERQETWLMLVTLAARDPSFDAPAFLSRTKLPADFRARVLASLSPPKEKKTKKKKALAVTKPPLDAKLLRTEKGREKLLDALGAWIVSALAKANDDAARAVMRGAITAFYDIREAAGQERGEYAGHFFMVDAVGLGDTDRPVPWNVLRARVGETRVETLSKLFDEALIEVK